METTEIDKRVLSLQRTYDAPLNLVWDAWTSGEHIAQWWGPKGMTTRVKAFDFKVGGRWEFVMDMPNGKEFASFGVYSEIIEHQKIVTSGNFPPMTEDVVLTTIFEDLGNKTRMTFSVTHKTEEYCRQQEAMGCMNGWGSVFDRLGEFVTA